MSQRPTSLYDDLIPTLEYQKTPPRRSWRAIVEDAVDAVGERFLTSVVAFCLYFGGLRIGGLIGVIMIILSFYAIRRWLKLWVEHSRW